MNDVHGNGDRHRVCGHRPGTGKTTSATSLPPYMIKTKNPSFYKNIKKKFTETAQTVV